VLRLSAEHADEKSDSAADDPDTDVSESELLQLLTAGTGAGASSSRRPQLKLPLSRRERLLMDSRECDRPKTLCASGASWRAGSGTATQRWRG
jgi:hypothetical protein